MKVWRYGCAIERLGGRYRLDGSLGSGGMADVYLAWDEREKREVAIKIMKTHDLDQQTLNRFLKEASQVVGWNYPHILHVYEDAKLELLDAANGSIVPYIVMEYVTGGDLHKRLKPGQPYPLAETLRIFAQLCGAVQYAHERNVIHRDLKPLNILFRRLPDGSEQVVLSDFGLAVQVDATHHTFAHGGTLAYMAPEQFRGQAVRASDIFALGVILYQLCTGKLPFRHSLQDFQHSGLFETPERPSVVNPSLPKTLDDAILKAIAEDPVKRFTSALLFWEQVRLAMMPPPKQEALLPLRKGGKDEKDTRPLANSLSPVTKSVHNGSELAIKGAKELVSLPKIVDNPDTRLVEFSQPYSENINQSPVSAVEPAPASQMFAPPPSKQLNILPPSLQPNMPPTPVPKPEVDSLATGSKNRRRWLAFMLILLTLLLIGGIALVSSGGLGSRSFVGIPGFTVTIIPASTVVSETYSINAVPGGTTGKSQVAARILTSTKSQSGTVDVTSGGHIPATYAIGSLTFYNTLTVSQTVAAGTILTGSDGVQVMNTQPAVIPAAHPPTEGLVTVSARAVTPGSKGNIPPLDINGSCCLSGVTVQNPSAFTGGQDAQTFKVVSQSDVNGFAVPLETSLMTAAKTDVANQKKTNEQFVGSVSCSSPSVTSSPPVGQAATKATVTVSVTCSGEVYDQQAAFSLAQTSLMTKASQSPGAGYALVGDILTTVKQANVVDSKGTVALLIFTEGRWAYQFSDAQKKTILPNLIKGKSKGDAQALLLQQPGVSKVSIDIAGGGNTLPTDPTQISIVVQPVQGFQGTPTPTAGPGTPTSPGSTATSGTSPTPIASPTAA